jgi:S-(hydroxymethyl)glutathione dehydrogenase/alcohol dehydrogenase
MKRQEAGVHERPTSPASRTRCRVVVTNIYPMSDSRPNLALSGLAQWEKQIVGCIFGSVNSRADIPMLLNLYQDGLLDLDTIRGVLVR